MSTGNSLLWFIAGAVAGAMTAVLLSPDSRGELNDKLRQGASDAVGKAKGKIAEGLEILENALEEK